jgi:hypothetical protein
MSITTILDDIYDSFGTPEECELFTQWVERFVVVLTIFSFHQNSNPFWANFKIKRLDTANIFIEKDTANI